MPCNYGAQLLENHNSNGDGDRLGVSKLQAKLKIRNMPSRVAFKFGRRLVREVQRRKPTCSPTDGDHGSMTWQHRAGAMAASGLALRSSWKRRGTVVSHRIMAASLSDCSPP